MQERWSKVKRKDATGKLRDRIGIAGGDVARPGGQITGRKKGKPDAVVKGRWLTASGQKKSRRKGSAGACRGRGCKQTLSGTAREGGWYRGILGLALSKSGMCAGWRQYTWGTNDQGRPLLIVNGEQAVRIDEKDLNLPGLPRGSFVYKGNSRSPKELCRT